MSSVANPNFETGQKGSGCFGEEKSVTRLATRRFVPISSRMTDHKPIRTSKAALRFRRLLERIERAIPKPLLGLWAGLRTPGAALIRLPIALFLVVGGVLSFLPVLGIWMLPLGLLLLALDVPILRGPLADTVIRVRRLWRWWQIKRNRR